MPNKSQEPVFQLIKSLTRSEKRHFRLSTSRAGATDDLKFLLLFDALDALDTYDDTLVLAQVPSLRRVQLANLKANLYRQVLSSLRVYHAGQNPDIQLHEQLDYARVLYNKGFYQQALRMLDKVKQAARQAEMPHIVLLALDFEKLIESQYITRSLEGRAETLTAEATDTVAHLTKMHALSNASLRLYGLYLKAGHARNRTDHEQITAFFRTHLPPHEDQQGNFFEKLYFYQAHVWYHTLDQDFRAGYRYAQKWVDLFEQAPHMKDLQAMLYIKGLHNLLASLYNLLYYSKFIQVLRTLEEFAASQTRRSSPNTEILLFQYLYTNRINAYFLEGRFTAGLDMVPELLEQLERYKPQLDMHRTLVFYYKIASLYFGSGRYEKAIEYLSLIIQHKDQSLREDLQCFARILSLIAHYEAGDDASLDYQIRSVYHFLGKMNDQQPMQVEIFRFLRTVGSIAPQQVREAFAQLRHQLTAIAARPYESRPFLYLDIISWLDSKIEGVPVQEIMQRKFRLMK
ncbi:tetratricopeptide repeat protein [Hymenobacter canadensis]|uniref:Tetratricopeptide repeat protein n=1 Tax=Hymenobacter canadensis TaxID=2999067 RepID=A0ABY7LU50_9BACT|nr:tetratricopeptide repeat protein [Hymenobacter canadensis]WBA43134.1 tetratricopeptide repeat protein [Hymenobacter canadensis]